MKKPLKPTVAIFPPNIVDVGYEPVIFLAGPIQGAANWQQKAIDFFIANTQELVIACPRTMGEWHRNWEGQVDWETFYLRKAADVGIILFWLAKEETHFCERPHGQCSRFELGEWVGRSDPDRRPFFALGIEEGFTNAKYIRRRLGQDFPHMEIYKTLEETLWGAIQNMVPF